MADRIDTSEAGWTATGGGPRISRRRPGRREEVHPSLIPLLRGTASPNIDDAPEQDAAPPSHREREADGLAPARGIMFGLAVSVPIWALLIFGACRLLGGIALEIVLSIPIWAGLSLAVCHLLD